jgi:hypothetical protein
VKTMMRSKLMRSVMAALGIRPKGQYYWWLYHNI